ncbi:MAG TPA: prepilin peptidase [Vicinamibacterales bacterium]|jgi:prepilin peptidase CpaA
MTTAQTVSLVLAAIACACDLRTRRIPRALTLGGAVAGLVFHVVTGGWTAGASSVAGWIVGIAILLVPFALGGLGGGDVKLLGALGAWLGPVNAIWLGLYTGIAGGAIALLIALSTSYLSQAITNIRSLLAHWRANGVTPLAEITLRHSRGPRVAYAIPILAGTMATLWLR